jgi:adenylyltransferase/sulfurtransferase
MFEMKKELLSVLIIAAQNRVSIRKIMTAGNNMNVPEISVQKLRALRHENVKFFLLDVRNPNEYAICNLNGYLIPLSELPSRINELNPEEYIIVHCHSGGRSRHAAEFLIQQGFKNVWNLRGGIVAWANEIDDTVPIAPQHANF